MNVSATLRIDVRARARRGRGAIQLTHAAVVTAPAGCTVELLVDRGYPDQRVVDVLCASRVGSVQVHADDPATLTRWFSALRQQTCDPMFGVVTDVAHDYSLRFSA
ncbi:hypothetical protein GTR02_01965 [Kineococcus sp. R8]|uniref:hypothetical protein n=1 Tax=Kineococcus siccus TaxID=2696567 RepID=UPI001412C819|nr:hypothetical protein [Kineococcus siccus]NAZ80585.1 hypothetical protein [Kineococcus siccus]